MAFPNLVPTSRVFDAGEYPIKNFRSQSGVEIRILYGSQRTGMKLELSYDNIADGDAQAFIDHYDEVNGSYGTFTIPSSLKTVGLEAPQLLTWPLVIPGDMKELRKFLLSSPEEVVCKYN